MDIRRYLFFSRSVFRFRGKPLALISSAMLVLALLMVSNTPASASSAPRCIDTDNSVSLTEGGPNIYHVHGRLCLPSGATPDTVQLLLPGGSYNHTYWDFPYQPQQYSYVRHMTQSGYATWNIDRIGTGLSSHPSGLSLSVYSGAFVIHQLVQDIRNGAVGGTSFKKVVLVGHSLGSVIAWAEAANYQDVDGTIITGMDHSPTIISATGAAYFAELTFPAPLDPNPKLRDRDATYVTTIPGLRGGPLFYNKDDVDPAVTKVDEQTKDTITALELATFAGPMIDGSSMRIHVPVLDVMGGKDGIFCGQIAAVDCSSAESLRAHEAQYYPRDTPLEAYTLKNSGHDINLHRNAQDWFNIAEQWMHKYFNG